jgi:hypothetical protein
MERGRPTQMARQAEKVQQSGRKAGGSSDDAVIPAS